MLQFEELKRELEEQEAALQDLGQALGLEKLREEVEMLEHKSAEPGFWDNMEQDGREQAEDAVLALEEGKGAVTDQLADFFQTGVGHGQLFYPLIKVRGHD